MHRYLNLRSDYDGLNLKVIGYELSKMIMGNYQIDNTVEIGWGARIHTQRKVDPDRYLSHCFCMRFSFVRTCS